MTAIRRFACGAALGFSAVPLLGGTTVFCESLWDRWLPAKLSGSSSSTKGGTEGGPDGAGALHRVIKPAHDKTWGVKWDEQWDAAAAATDEHGSPIARRRKYSRQILLIRHGQYQNEGGNHDDDERTLTPLGEQQALETGEYLKLAFDQVAKQHALHHLFREAKRSLRHAREANAKPEEIERLETALREAAVHEKTEGGFLVNGSPSVVRVSNMVRAKQTAKLILDAFPAEVQERLRVDADLRERFPCDPTPYYKSTSANERDMVVAEALFTKYFHRPQADESSVEIIVGHGNVIRYLTMRALQLPPEAWLRMNLPHCSITNLVINGSGHVKLVGLGSFGHLAPADVTTDNVKG